MAKMSKQEKAIREERTNQAVKKDFMGTVGKLGMIARFLGSPIIRQGGGFLDQNFLDDPFDIEEEGMPTMGDSQIQEEGYAFNGLGLGMHIDIIYLHSRKTLTVDYKGYRVYTETGGDLNSYAPHPEWESHVETLFKAAKVKKKRLELEMEPAMEIEINEKRIGWFEAMRQKWGWKNRG